MLRGYLEHADRFTAHGWCFDTEAPTRRPTVELRSGARVLARLTASQFRGDLANIDLGDGRHAFLASFDPPLAEADLEGLHAITVDGPGPPEILANLEAVRAATAAPTLAFPGQSVDADAHPVFVLGAARSGTTAIAQALLCLPGWQGHGEGHMLDILAHWTGVTGKFYDHKYDDTLPESETMLAAVPQAFLQAGLDHLLVATTRTLYGTARWVEKTPNSDPIYMAPRYRRIWPNARFIFLRRRAFENIASRGSKFPGYAFRQNCLEWSEAMKAWSLVRGQLTGSAIELDQRCVGRRPDLATAALASLLGLDTAQTQTIGRILAHERPERTAELPDRALTRDGMAWSAEEGALFDEMCQPWMDAYGYTDDTTYHATDPTGGLRVI